MATLPVAMPPPQAGAAALCVHGRGVGALLGAAPRAALHEALTTGGALGPGARAEAAKGLGPWSEDAAVAYQLLLQVCVPPKG